MDQAETEILLHFRQYQMQADQMLCFNSGLAKSHPPRFKSAMASLIKRGLVIAQSQRNAYALTQQGYQASVSV